VARIRGSSFVAINRWITDRLNGERYEGFLSRLREPVAHTLAEAEVWSWYSLEYLTEIFESVVEAFGGKNGGILDELGGFLAEADLGGAPKTRLGRLPVPRALARLPYLWSKCKDCGEFHILSVDESARHAVLVLSYFDGGILHCSVIRAWLERITKLMSRNKITVREKSCRWKNGGNACYWEVTWE